MSVLFLLIAMLQPANAVLLHAQRHGETTWLPIIHLEPDTRAIERNGLLYMALRSGLGIWDPVAKSLEVIPLNADINVSELRGLEMVDGKIWIITRKSGVSVFDPDARKLAGHFHIGEKLDAELQFGYNGNMNAVYDRFGDAIWFGHFVNVDQYRISTGKWTSLNPAIKAAGIGRPGSWTSFTIRAEGVWLHGSASRDGNGGTLFCDHAAENCRLADSQPPPEPAPETYKDCGASARFELAVCGDEIVKRIPQGWEVIFTNRSPFGFPFHPADPSNSGGPFIACRGNDVLMVANGGLRVLDAASLRLWDVKGGEGFELKGSWGTRAKEDRLLITQDYEDPCGCGNRPPHPSDYHSFNFSSRELVRLSSGPSAHEMARQGAVCDLPGGMRIQANGAGLKIAKLRGPTLEELERERIALQQLDARCAAEWRFRDEFLPRAVEQRFLRLMSDRASSQSDAVLYPVLELQRRYLSFLSRALESEHDPFGGPGIGVLAKETATRFPELFWLTQESAKVEFGVIEELLRETKRASAQPKQRSYYPSEFEEFVQAMGWRADWESFRPLPQTILKRSPECLRRSTAPEVREAAKFFAETDLALVVQGAEFDAALAKWDAFRAGRARAEEVREALAELERAYAMIARVVLRPMDNHPYPEETYEALVELLDKNETYGRYRPENVRRAQADLRRDLAKVNK